VSGIPTGTAPLGVAVDTRTNTSYVVSQNDATLSVLVPAS
jgi:DNA-binding beta-propeller fold protein YncE